MNKATTSVQRLCRSALLLAVLITVQYVTKPFGQLITGSCVNTVLALSAIMFGAWVAVPVAIISPFIAFLLGIGPAILLLAPLIAVGNLCYVLVCSYLIGKLSKSLIYKELCIAAASVVKFGVLYLGAVKLIIPLLANNGIKNPALSVMFSWPQLVTALIGGTLAVVISALIGKANKQG